MPTETPNNARSMSITEILSKKKAPVPDMMYKARPAMAISFDFMNWHKRGKHRLVMMMKSAGRLTMNCIRRSGLSAKCAFTAHRAGAMAAPAITVRRLRERIVNFSRSEICFVCIIFEFNKSSSCGVRALPSPDSSDSLQTLTNPQCKGKKFLKKTIGYSLIATLNLAFDKPSVRVVFIFVLCNLVSVKNKLVKIYSRFSRIDSFSKKKCTSGTRLMRK